MNNQLTERQLFEQFQRECLYAFVVAFFQVVAGNRRYRRAFHVEAMCVALESAARGETKRLIITVPPRYLKSYTIAIAFVAWVLGKDPTKKVMVASYGADLAEEHANGFRRIIHSAAFKRMFPGFRMRSDTNDETSTTEGGGRKAISVGGAATGHGADILIIDDLLKAGDALSEILRTKANDFFDTSLFTRLNVKEDAVVIVLQQRLHEDDLVGHLLEQGGWVHMNMPAIADRKESFPLYLGRTFVREPGDLLAPGLEGYAALEEARVRLGRAAYQAQYLLDPIPPDGNIISWSWFKRYEYRLEREDYDYVVQSWDTATSDDPDAAYSVCMTFGHYQGVWDLLHIYRGKLRFPALCRQAKHLYKDWRPDRVLVEDASSGRQLSQTLIEWLGEGRRRIVPYPSPLMGKEERLDLQSVKIERGDISLPISAPWLDAFKNELMRFPLGKYKDQVDALTQFLEWTSGPQGRAVRPRDPVTGEPGSSRRPRGTDYNRRFQSRLIDRYGDGREVVRMG